VYGTIYWFIGAEYVFMVEMLQGKRQAKANLLSKEGKDFFSSSAPYISMTSYEYLWSTVFVEVFYLLFAARSWPLHCDTYKSQGEKNGNQKSKTT
jgi:hypothetical protein